MQGKSKSDRDDVQNTVEDQESDSPDDRDERPYYYDDAHGYEKFDPDAATEEEDQN